MTGLSCVLWWLVLGALLGWLASWLVGRAYRSALPAPRVVETIVERPVERVVEKIVEKPVDRPVDSPALLAQVASLSADAGQVPQLRAELSRLQAELDRLRAPVWPAIDVAAAKAAGFEIAGDDDLEVIEGIGPKIAELLKAAGIRTFAELAQASVLRLREILDAAGPNYRIADPATWPEQSTLCAKNEWAALKVLQQSLTAGRR